MVAALIGVSAAHALDANNRNGIKGIKMAINTERIHRSGEEVQFSLMVTNDNAKDENGVNISFLDSEAKIDGERCYMDGNLNFGSVDLPAEETVGINTWISDVPVNAETITSIKIVGRAPNSSKSTQQNPYGDFDYRFSNIALPSFPASNKPGCVFYDNEISLYVGEITVDGNNLVISFTLTNNGRKDYTIEAGNFGYGVARTPDGDEYDVFTQISNNLPVGEAVKGQIIIAKGADETFASVRQQFDLSQNRNYWKPGLLLRNISK